MTSCRGSLPRAGNSSISARNRGMEGRNRAAMPGRAVVRSPYRPIPDTKVRHRAVSKLAADTSIAQRSGPLQQPYERRPQVVRNSEMSILRPLRLFCFARRRQAVTSRPSSTCMRAKSSFPAMARRPATPIVAFACLRLAAGMTPAPIIPTRGFDAARAATRIPVASKLPRRKGGQLRR